MHKILGASNGEGHYSLFCITKVLAIKVRFHIAALVKSSITSYISSITCSDKSILTMKAFALVLILSGLFLTCEKKECCVLVDTFVDISVLEKSSNKDLLNPNADNHYDIKKVALEFSAFPNKKTGIDAIQYSKPLFFQKGDKYYLRIFPTTSEPLGEKHTVTIYWDENDADKVTFYLNRTGGNAITEKILVNDELKWEQSKGYKEITILK
jgi:hypothetical protein